MTTNPTPDELKARAALRDLPRPAADPEFRARLRREFASGTIESRLGGVVAPDLPDSSHPGIYPGDARGRVVRGPWVARTPVRYAWLAAAAAALVVAVIQLDRPPQWQVTDASGQGIAVVDGRPIPMNHETELALALRPGARVQVPIGTRLELTNAGNLVIQFLSGTEAVVPKAPGRWFNRSVQGEIMNGQLRITTGARFAGAKLMILSPEAAVEVAGTTLAVIRESHGTCVCVLEGTVMVGPREGDRIAVEGGRRRFMFSDGRDEADEMRPGEHEALSEMKDGEAPSMWP